MDSKTDGQVETRRERGTDVMNDLIADPRCRHRDGDARSDGENTDVRPGHR